MFKRMICKAALIFCLGVSHGQAEEKAFTLSASPQLAENGFLGYVLPRFSLKTGVRITVVAPPGADAALTRDAGQVAFAALSDGALFGYDVATADPDAQRFGAWLRSETGQRTIASFAPDGDPVYGPPPEVVEEEVAMVFDGDIDLGGKLSLSLCGRCHVVSEANRMNGLGSTPSFAALRAMADWEGRFLAFYALNPHPSFTQIEGISTPFDPMRPSPIAPVEMTADDLDAIIAFVAVMEPANLGAPVQAQ